MYKAVPLNPTPISLLAPAIVGGLIAAGGTIAGSVLGKTKAPAGPAEDPQYAWLRKQGPDMWNALKGQGMNLMQNPYGLEPEARAAMARQARSGAGAGYESSKRNIKRELQLSGLSPGGGESDRRQYLAGRQFGEDIGAAYSDIEVLDFQAREQQRARGENLLMNLSTSSPAYSQVASQNYWNGLNYMQAQNAQMSQAIGGAMGAGYDMYMQYKNPYQNPYQTQQSGGYTAPSPYQGGYTDQSGYSQGGYTQG